MVSPLITDDAIKIISGDIFVAANDILNSSAFVVAANKGY
jgi:hypothetical protein